MNKLQTIVVAGLAWGISHVAAAEEVEGVVRAAGSSFNAQTMLTEGGSETGPKLCANEVGKKVRRLGAMTVKATGEWKLDKKGEKSCFEASDFTVLKASSGRDVVVGTLAQKDGAFSVTGADGKTHVLEDVPGGLKKLDGQKVILDLKPINSPTAKEAVYKVVTYAAHP